jgi:hypothetical protein
MKQIVATMTAAALASGAFATAASAIAEPEPVIVANYAAHKIHKRIKGVDGGKSLKVNCKKKGDHYKCRFESVRCSGSIRVYGFQSGATLSAPKRYIKIGCVSVPVTPPVEG